ncbi:MAG: putative amidoligase domain-containing protein [Candidatus Odinarchaeia archaeon]|nr:MAG: COOH.NH2 ligase T2 [Lokiarchaeota virus Fenrir Meg22_1012]URC17299.1 MAG: COOH.NH2 ligase T2 [Lokiarchaeota virus Fenrir Meg22_1214]
MLIGCDPEFLILNRSGSIYSARDDLDFCSTHEPIGCDGAGTPLELRPHPSNHTRIVGLTHNVEVLLYTLKKIFIKENRENLWLRSGAFYNGQPIGCHIHMGGNCKPLNCKSIKVISHLLVENFIPIIWGLIPSEELYKRVVRSDYCYGVIDSNSMVRSKSHGFEFRVPYSFISSPLHLRGGFAIVSLIAEYWRKLKTSPEIFSLLRDLNEDKDWGDAYWLVYQHAKQNILRMMKWGSPYPRFNGYILSLFSLIERGKKMSYDVFENFGYNASSSLKKGKPHIIVNMDDYMEPINEIVDLWRKAKREILTPENTVLYGVRVRDGDDPISKASTTMSIFISDKIEYYGDEMFVRSIYSRDEDGVFKEKDLTIKIVRKSFGVGNTSPYSIGFSRSLRSFLFFNCLEGNVNRFLRIVLEKFKII